jgi:hypothetical protein
MTDKVISLSFVIPTALAAVLGIALAVGGVYLGHYLGPADQAKANQPVAGGSEIADLPNPEGRLSRVHLLLSNMK